MSSSRSRSGGRSISNTPEPVVEVFAELAALHRGVQVAVGGGDHADVGAHHARAAEAHELALLEHAQQLGLHGGRHLADLVEEQHAAGGLLDASRLGRDGAGEGAALVAEELRFEQLVGQRRAVDGDERSVIARARRGGGTARRLPCRCPTRRSSSTVVSVCATRVACASTSFHCLLCPTTRRTPPRASSSRVSVATCASRRAAVAAASARCWCDSASAR